MRLLEEDRLSLTELARQEGVNTATVWRWAQRGVRGFRLETLRVGGKTFTSRQAFARWVAATNDDASAIPSRTNRQRQSSIDAAERELEAAGI